ncbi:MAG TPA: hypothetical protein VL486_08675 [Verrucomicrobiae bacterium]|nr:hypothetical protein [Verrucomicrobiae bacterium]
MSNPDENQGQAGETRPPQRPADQPMDVPTAIGQLRSLVCGLGVGLAVVSLALSAFVLKQNRNLAGTIRARQAQIVQLRSNRQQITYVLNELAKYSMGKPELTALFAKHGVRVENTGSATEPIPGPTTPAAPSAPSAPSTESH